MTIQQAELNLLRLVVEMYANGKDDMGKEARKALRATKPRQKRKAR
jgi:hypothetical protein